MASRCLPKSKAISFCGLAGVTGLLDQRPDHLVPKGPLVLFADDSYEAVQSEGDRRRHPQNQRNPPKALTRGARLAMSHLVCPEVFKELVGNFTCQNKSTNQLDSTRREAPIRRFLDLIRKRVNYIVWKPLHRWPPWAIP